MTSTNVGPDIGDDSAAAILIHRYAVDTDTPIRAAAVGTASPRCLTARISSLRSSDSRIATVSAPELAAATWRSHSGYLCFTYGLKAKAPAVGADGMAKCDTCGQPFPAASMTLTAYGHRCGECEKAEILRMQSHYATCCAIAQVAPRARIAGRDRS